MDGRKYLVDNLLITITIIDAMMKKQQNVGTTLKGVIRKVALVAVIAMALSATTFAQTSTILNPSDSLRYTINTTNNTAIVSGDARLKDSCRVNINKHDVVIPATISYGSQTYQVVGIASKAFFKDSLVNKVTFSPNTNSFSIGSEAFRGCYRMDGSIDLSAMQGLTSIGDYAFYNCVQLNGTLKLPTSYQTLTSIGQYAFYNCSQLSGTGILLPTSMTTISAYAFYGCSHLQNTLNVATLTSLSAIGAYAFYGCSGLQATNLYIGNLTIGNYAFQNCSGLRGTLTIGNGATLGTGSFRGCTGFNGDLNLSSILSVPAECFYGCSGFSRLSLRETADSTDRMTTIGNSAFRNCTGITQVTLPNCQHLNSIGSYAFAGDTNMNVVGGNTILPNTLTTIGSYAFQNCYKLDKNLTIPVGMTNIAEGVFQSCVRIPSVSFANVNGTLTTIGANAFRNDISLSGNLTLPSALQTLGSYAFYGCNNYYCNLNIPDNVKTIGSYAFYGCSSLSGNLSLPLGLTSLGSYAFYNCQGLSGHLIIPHGITNINNYTFYNCNGLQSITLSPNITTIGTSAYYNCTNLEGRLTIPTNVTTLGDNCFRNCKKLEGSLVIPNNVTTIGSYAFYGDTNFSGTLTIGHSVDVISSYAFYGIASDNRIGFDTIRVLRNVPPALGSSNAFYKMYRTRVMVPCGSADDYKSSQWGNYATSVNYLTRDSIFEQNNYILNAATDPNYVDMGHVVVIREATCDSAAIVSAIANHGYRFDKWVNSDGATVDSTNATLHLIPQSDTTIMARFTIDNFNIVVAPQSTRFGSTQGSGNYEYKTWVTISASPNTKFHFKEWTDANGGVFSTDNPCLIQVLDNAQYIARFDSTCTVYGLSADNTKGSVIGIHWNNDNNVYDTVFTNGHSVLNDGDSITLKANPTYGYRFLRWNDGNTTNPRTATIAGNATGNLSYTAYFTLDTFQITTSVDSLNSIALGIVAQSGNGTYDYNTSATLTATAAYGYVFKNWTNDRTHQTYTANPLTFTVNSDSAFTAHFVRDSFYVNVVSNISGAGTQTLDNHTTQGANYAYGDTAIVCHTTNDGYYFVKWLPDNSTEDCDTVVVLADITITAQYSAGGQNVYAAAAENGNISINGGGNATSDTGHFAYGAQISILATANYGYHFTKWIDSADNNREYTANPLSVTLTHDMNLTAFFSKNSYTVATSSANNTMGTVAPATHTYEYLDTVILTATPRSGYNFSHWSNGADSNTISVIVRSDTNFVAYFTLGGDTIKVLISPSCDGMGNVAGGGIFVHNSQTTISATANPGYHFIGWGDNNNDNPRLITVSSSRSYTASFDSNQYTLTVLANNDEMGSVTGSGTYNYLHNVTMTPTANNHYKFAGWEDGNTNNPRTISLTEDATYIANFEPMNYTVNVTSSNNAHGTVTGGGNYSYGTQITFSATNNYGYHFAKWNDGNADNPRVISVNADITYTAIFERDSFYINVTSADAVKGTAVASGRFPYDTTITIVAAPAEGYRFIRWNDGVLDSIRNVTVKRDSLFTAYFQAERYFVYVSSSDTTMGTTTGTGEFDFNDHIQLTAVADSGYRFTRWSDGDPNPARFITVPNHDVYYVAHFARDSFHVSGISSNLNNGFVTGTNDYTYGSTATLEAHPYVGYRCTHWTCGNDTIYNNPIYIVVTSDSSFVAHFSYGDYTVRAYAGNEGGDSVSGSGCYPSDTRVTMTAYPSHGYRFVQWNDGNTDNPRRFYVVCDTVFRAFFDTDTFTVAANANNSQMGTIEGTGNFLYGATIDLTAVPACGYHFSMWSDSVTANPRAFTIVSDTTITAIFDTSLYDITTTVNEANGGTVEGSGQYKYGATVTLTVTANTGYTFTKWSDGNTDNPRTVVVTCDNNQQYRANFTAHTTVTASTTDVCLGSSVTLTAQGSADIYSFDGGITYSSSNTLTTTPTAAGTMTYTVIGANATQTFHDTVTITITTHTLPTIGLSASQNSVCTGTAVTLTGSGATEYSWDNGVTFTTGSTSTQNPTANTTYTVIGQDQFGCRGTASTSITVASMPTVALNASTTMACVGDELILTASGATNYSWDGTNYTTYCSKTEVPAAGIHDYTVYGYNDNSECSSSATVTVTVNEYPQATIYGEHEFCEGEPVTLSVETNGTATSVNWSASPAANVNFGGQNIQTNISAQITGSALFQVVASNNGCNTKATYAVHMIPTPDVHLSVDNAHVCQGTKVNFVADGGVAYSWDNGNTWDVMAGHTENAEYTHEYTVLAAATADGRCTAPASVTVMVDAMPNTMISGPNNDSSCLGYEITLTASTDVGEYTWSSEPNDITLLLQETSESITVSPTERTKYILTTVNGHCTTTTSRIINVGIMPTAKGTTNSATISRGMNPVEFTDISVNNKERLWYDSISMEFMSDQKKFYYNVPTDVDTFTAMLIAINGGCAETTYVHVIMVDDQVWAANAFTPDEASNNRFYATAKNVTGYHLAIYNRQGQLVFETDDMEEGWNGTVKNQGNIKCPQGSYVYIVTSKTRGSGGMEKTNTGTVTLIR